MNVGVEKTSLESVDISKVLALLPHRYPFLLIDRIIDIDGSDSAIGIKNVTINEPHFMGHFPEQPVMPGVLIIESMAQTAGAIALLAQGDTNKGVVYLMTVDNVKFRKPVVPGDQLKLHVKKIKQRGNIIRFACVGEVDGNRVAEAEVSAMLTVGEKSK